MERFQIILLSRVSENRTGQIHSGKKLDITMDPNLFWEFVINHQMKNTMKLRKWSVK
jgi:hypothetical protein